MKKLIMEEKHRFPHARGGVSTRATRWSSICWFSPRTWGCFLKGWNFDVGSKVFPTHVGVFLLLRRMKEDGRGFPHARGGVSIPERKESHY